MSAIRIANFSIQMFIQIKLIVPHSNCWYHISLITLHAKLSGVVYCYRSCLFATGGRCLWVCYHDNSKLRASIFTKLGLQMKVVTVSSWLNFGHPAPREGGLRLGGGFWLCLTTAIADSAVRLWGDSGGRAVFASLWALFHLILIF